MNEIELALNLFGPTVLLGVGAGFAQYFIFKKAAHRAWLVPIPLVGAAVTAFLLYKAETASGYWFAGLDFLIYSLWAVGVPVGALVGLIVAAVRRRKLKKSSDTAS